MQEKLAEREKADSASKTAPKERKKVLRLPISVWPRFEARLANVKTVHLRLVDGLARGEKDASKAKTELRGLQVRFFDVVVEAKAANKN